MGPDSGERDACRATLIHSPLNRVREDTRKCGHQRSPVCRYMTRQKGEPCEPTPEKMRLNQSFALPATGRWLTYASIQLAIVVAGIFIAFVVSILVVLATGIFVAGMVVAFAVLAMTVTIVRVMPVAILVMT